MPLICIASPKGGVGKTTLAANLAHALLREGRRVLAIDLDPQNALRLHFGLPPTDHAGFAAGLAQHPAWQDRVRQTASGVLLLPHGTLELRGALALAAALEREPALLTWPVRAMLADPTLLLVADLPPGPSHVLDLLAPLAALVVVVLLADANGAALVPEIDSGRFLDGGARPRMPAPPLRLVLNQVDHASRLSRRAAEALAGHFGPRLLGAIAREDAVPEALAAQRLLLDAAPGSQAARDLQAIGRAVAACLPMAQPMPQPMPPPPPAPLLAPLLAPLAARPAAAVGGWWGR